MNGLAGIVNQQPQGASLRASLLPITQALEHRGFPCITCEPRAALATFVRGNESAPDTFLCDSEGWKIAWHGSLHNPKEASRRLELDYAAIGDDARVVLSAWRRYAQECLDFLIGDFAFAIWDPAGKRLFAARDPGGLRPFFYSAKGPQFAFASEVRALLHAPQISRDLDETMIAEFLLWWSAYPDVERTFFSDIKRLPPGHWLKWDSNSLTIQQWWRIDPARRLVYPRTSDYQERFQEIFSEAVRCRLNKDHPSAVFLSGGLDSSSVAAQASRWSGRVLAYTGKVPGVADESHLAQEVAVRCNIPHRIFIAPPTAVGPHVESFIQRQASPVADQGFVNDNLLIAAARKDGCRTIMTGDGGDEVLGTPIGYLADLIRTGKLLEMKRVLRTVAVFHIRSEASLLKPALLLLVPRWCKVIAKSWKWRQPPAWFNSEFANRTKLLARLRRVPAREPLHSISVTEDYFALFRGRRTWMDEAREIEAAHLGASFTYPFLDRRLLEFLFAIPWNVRMQGTRNKGFLRNWEGLLPPAISEIRAKADYAAYWTETNGLTDWNQNGLEPRIAFERFLNPDFFIAAISQARDVGPRTAPPLTFWTTHRFLLWLRQYGMPNTGAYETVTSLRKTA